MQRMRQHSIMRLSGTASVSDRSGSNFVPLLAQPHPCDPPAWRATAGLSGRRGLIDIPFETAWTGRIKAGIPAHDLSPT
jgi:hypothetical protein